MTDIHDPLDCEFCHTEGYAAEYEAMKAERDKAIQERDTLYDNLGEMTALANTMEAERDAARKERDHLRAAIEEHSAQIIMGGLVGATAKDADEALWAALDPSPSPEPPEAA